jgi:hypothetical protein
MPRLQLTQELIIMLMSVEASLSSRNTGSQYPETVQPKGRKFTDLMTTTGISHDTMGVYDLGHLQQVLGRPYDKTAAYYAVLDLNLLLLVQWNGLFNESKSGRLYSRAMRDHDMWPSEEGANVCLPFLFDPLYHRRLMNYFTIGVSSDTRYQGCIANDWMDILAQTPWMRRDSNFHPAEERDVFFTREFPDSWGRNPEPIHSTEAADQWYKDHPDPKDSEAGQFDKRNDATFLLARWHYLNLSAEAYRDQMNEHQTELDRRLDLHPMRHGRLFHANGP